MIWGTAARYASHAEAGPSGRPQRFSRLVPRGAFIARGAIPRIRPNPKNPFNNLFLDAAPSGLCPERLLRCQPERPPSMDLSQIRALRCLTWRLDTHRTNDAPTVPDQ